MRVLLMMAVVVSLPGVIYSFHPLFSFDGKSTTHRDITQRAALRKTAEVCRDIAASEGRDFSLTIDDSVSFAEVQTACSSTSLRSTFMFINSIANMYLSNAIVDVAYALSEKHHFDNERFHGGRDVITTGVAAVKASVRRENFVAGRSTLGGVFHTLQDFYSHSNWVELGNIAPYSTLIKPEQPLQNLAGLSTPTCRNCIGGNCGTNLLEQSLLTSGYFNLFSPEKPAGGFKEQYIFILRSTVIYSGSMLSVLLVPVVKNKTGKLTSIDASKAFDCINHGKLFGKLHQRGVPFDLIRILQFWYSHQTMQVRWGMSLSTPFYVSNGVRQGGILSPLLFNLNMDDLFRELKGCRTGCLVGDSLLNHMLYADDLVVLPPVLAYSNFLEYALNMD